MPNLTIRRDRGWADKMRKYRILMDGVEIDRLGEGAESSWEISSGPHVMEARIDWCGSHSFRFEARSGDLVVLVRSALRGWRLLLTLNYIIFRRRGYLTLELKRCGIVGRSGSDGTIRSSSGS